MKNRAKFVYAIFACILALISCSRTNDKTQQCIIQAGTEKLTLKQIYAIVPDSAYSSTRATQAAFRIALSSLKSEDSSLFNKNRLQDLAQMLSLQSGIEYTPEGAKALLLASNQLGLCEGNLISPSLVLSRAESIYVATVLNPDGSKPSLPFVKNNVDTASFETLNTQSMARLLAALFGLPEPTARALADYIKPVPDNNAQLASVSKQVKNLIFDPKQDNKAKPKKIRATEISNVDCSNSALGLKYRSHQSIHDSIEKHSPNIQEIYKRYLKQNQASGVVKVKFQVNTLGQVTSVSLESSDIHDQKFEQQMLDYAQTIHFQPIPEKVGCMVFEFPFEFNAEM